MTQQGYQQRHEARSHTLSLALWLCVVCALLWTSSWGHWHALRHGTLHRWLAAPASHALMVDFQAGTARSPSVWMGSAVDDADQGRSAGAGHTAADCLVLDHLALGYALPVVMLGWLLSVLPQAPPLMVFDAVAYRHQSHFLARAPPPAHGVDAAWLI